MPNGKIQPEFTDTLVIVGAWVQKNGEAIYGTRGSGIPAQPWGVITQKDKNLYVHVMTPPQQPYVFIPQLKGKVTKAALLADGSAVKFKQQTEGVFVYLSGVATDPNDTIIKLTTN